MRFLERPARTMAGRSAQMVNNLPTEICTDRFEGAEHRILTRQGIEQESTPSLIQVLEREKIQTGGRFNTPPRRSYLNYGRKISSYKKQSARRYMYGSMRRRGAPNANNIRDRPGDYTPNHTGLRTGQNMNRRKIQYASSKVPLELWPEGWHRQSMICL